MSSAWVKVVKFLAVFVALFVSGSYLLLMTLGPWTEWQIRNCFPGEPAVTTYLCDVSRPVLAYWWVFFVPVMLFLAYLIAAAWWRARDEEAPERRGEPLPRTNPTTTTNRDYESPAA